MNFKFNACQKLKRRKSRGIFSRKMATNSTRQSYLGPTLSFTEGINIEFRVRPSSNQFREQWNGNSGVAIIWIRLRERLGFKSIQSRTTENIDGRGGGRLNSNMVLAPRAGCTAGQTILTPWRSRLNRYEKKSLPSRKEKISYLRVNSVLRISVQIQRGSRIAN